MGLSKEMLEELRGCEQGDLPVDDWRRKTVKRMEKLLEEVGFHLTPNDSDKGTISTFYHKEDIELVFCEINTKRAKGVSRKGIYYTLIDKKTWDKIKNFEPKLNISADGNYVTIYLKEMQEGMGNVSGDLLHRFLKRDEVSEERPLVDHVTHNGFININSREFLRVCNVEQNDTNNSRRQLADVQKDTLSFYVGAGDVPLQKEDIIRKFGLQKASTYFYSKEFPSEEELYKKIGEVEKEIYGEFRYDPLKDFSQTWYVLVYEKMLGKISHEEAEEYQRDYFKRIHPDIAKYYGLLWD